MEGFLCVFFFLISLGERGRFATLVQAGFGGKRLDLPKTFPLPKGEKKKHQGWLLLLSHLTSLTPYLIQMQHV